MHKIKKYDIWLLNLEPTKWNEQSWIRPCLVIQNNEFFEYQGTTIVLPITWKNKEDWKFRILIKDFENYWLTLESTILSFQIRTADKSRFIKKIWEITDEKLKQKIKESLILSLDIDDEFE